MKKYILFILLVFCISDVNVVLAHNKKPRIQRKKIDPPKNDYKIKSWENKSSTGVVVKEHYLSSVDELVNREIRGMSSYVSSNPSERKVLLNKMKSLLMDHKRKSLSSKKGKSLNNASSAVSELANCEIKNLSDRVLLEKNERKELLDRTKLLLKVIKQNERKEMFGGFYVGAGVTQINSNAEVVNVERSYECSQDAGQSCSISGSSAAISADRDNILSNLFGYGVSDVSDIRVSSGNRILHFNAFGSDSAKVMDKKLVKMSGSAACGYGRFVDDIIYLGGDFVLDFLGEKNISASDNSFPKASFGDIKLKQGEIVPTIALRLGAYCQMLDSLIFARIGASHTSLELISSFGNINLSKIVPIIGGGIDTNIKNNASLRCEFDYRIQSEKSANLSHSLYDVDLNPQGIAIVPLSNRVDLKHSAKFNIASKGYAVRVMLMWNI